MLHSNSRENQDLVLLTILNGKKNGTYLEIGANQPIVDNNTYLLEKEFNWRGVSVEFQPHFVNQFSITRKNPCVCADATTLNYTTLLNNNNLGPHIDFLQVDIEPPSNTLKALKQIEFNKFSFSFITFEHDFYNGGISERLESRAIIESYGYTLMLSDVSHGGLIFEDWYVNEKYMPNDNWKYFTGDKINMNTSSMPEHLKLKITEILTNI